MLYNNYYIISIARNIVNKYPTYSRYSIRNKIIRKIILYLKEVRAKTPESD